MAGAQKDSRKSMGKALKDVVDISPGKTAEERERRRMESVLMNRNRRRIMQYLLKHPCCKSGDIAEGLSMSTTTVKWHLRKLREKGFVEERIVYKKPVFYLVKMIADREIISAISLVQSGFGNRLMAVLIENPGLAQGDISNLTGKSDQTCRQYLGLLETHGLVEVVVDGRHRRYYPTERISAIRKASRKRMRSFRTYLLKRLEEERLEPEIHLTTTRAAEILVKIGRERDVFRVPDEISVIIEVAQNP